MIESHTQTLAAQWHWQPRGSTYPMVQWKDVLTGAWKGLDPVLIWGHGRVCLFPQDIESPIWIPEWFTSYGWFF